MKYMLIAGEASGDLHASQLIKSLRELDPEADFRFFGGDLMAAAAGRQPEVHYRELNYMGFSEVLRNLGTVLQRLRYAKRLMRAYRPDTLILIDYPGFNLRMARAARKAGIRVDYYISPKVWAWKQWRVRSMRRDITALYSILPFETQFFKRHGCKAIYVGNPSVEEVAEELRHIPSLKHFLSRQGLDGDPRPIIALLPGSRQSEIRNNLPIMLEAARRFPAFRYIVAAAPSIPERFYRQVAEEKGLDIAFDATLTLVKYAAAALVTSGTATLETALVGTPQVVCYRANGSRLSYSLMKRILSVKYVSLPNLVLQQPMLPELLLHNCTADAVARNLAPLLENSPKLEWQKQGYRLLRRRLGTTIAPQYAAQLIYEAISKS